MGKPALDLCFDNKQKRYGYTKHCLFASALDQLLIYYPVHQLGTATTVLLYSCRSHLRQSIRCLYSMVSPPSYLLVPSKSFLVTGMDVIRKILVVHVMSNMQHTRQYAYSDALKNSYFPRTIPVWNSLPSSVVSSKTIEEFKASI